MHLLVTRPNEQARQTAHRLQQEGHTVTIEPLLEIFSKVEEPIPSASANPFSAIIVTSANASEGLDVLWPLHERELVPVITTGEATKNVLISLGFKKCVSVNGSALKLLDAVPQWMAEENLSIDDTIFYPCAYQMAHDLEKELKIMGIHCVSRPIYRARPQTKFSNNVVTMLMENRVDGVLLYSARTAETFVSLMDKYQLPLDQLNTYVLSEQIFDSLPGLMKNNCQYPREPSEAALFRLLRD